MTAPAIAFFNNKGGVGKTSLAYHLAWMYAEEGKRVLAADLDPQANLTAAFLDEDRMAELWEPGESKTSNTLYQCISPLLSGTGDISSPELQVVDDSIALLPGDLSLSKFEDELSNSWSDCLARKERAFRVMTAIWRIIQTAVEDFGADMVLMDVGPNLGSINRSAMVASDHVVVPLAPDLFSIQGLKNLGPQLREWREAWKERLEKNPKPDELRLPQGGMSPVGYVIMQHSVRMDRPAKSYEKWAKRIPGVYSRAVLNVSDNIPEVPDDDDHCLGMLKHYRSLMPMAQEARKPIFRLKSADGAIGSHQASVQTAFDDYRSLAKAILSKIA